MINIVRYVKHFDITHRSTLLQVTHHIILLLFKPSNTYYHFHLSSPFTHTHSISLSPSLILSHIHIKIMDKKPCNSSQDPEVRKGPWTMEEDLILINYIANHGEGVWNSLAKAAGNFFKKNHTFNYILITC